MRPALAQGPRPGQVILAGLAVLAVAAAGLILLKATARPAPAARASAARYGGLPAWLPKPTVPVGRVVHASAAHPALGIEGDAIVVHVGSAEVKATAVGPQVPEEGKFPVPTTSPCTFIVTFAAASAAIPLRAADFTVLDEDGRLHYLRITAMAGGPEPGRVLPGQTVSLAMSAVLPTGSGTLRWSLGSSRPVASWDFDVEID